MQWWCYLSQCGVAFYVFMTFFAYWSLLLLCQCIQGLPEGALRRIILTASGGAFRQVHSHMCLCTSRNIRIHLISIDHYRDWPVDKLKDVKVADALKHPNWNMGKKITVDSATLFNKVT